jgi:hypothetical protein
MKQGNAISLDNTWFDSTCSGLYALRLLSYQRHDFILTIDSVERIHFRCLITCYFDTFGRFGGFGGFGFGIGTLSCWNQLSGVRFRTARVIDQPDTSDICGCSRNKIMECLLLFFSFILHLCIFIGVFELVEVC